MSLVDTMQAKFQGSKINLDAPVQIPTATWELACLIGATVSLVLNGYEDAFDGMDWEDAAREVRGAISLGKPVNTRADLIKLIREFGYNLEDYA